MTYKKVIKETRKLDYSIPLEIAKEKRVLIAKILAESGIVTCNERLQSLALHRYGQTVTQLGAVQWGGDQDKIEETGNVSYIELRFYDRALSPSTVERLSAITDCRDDSPTALRFRFWEQHLEEVDKICFRISAALK